MATVGCGDAWALFVGKRCLDRDLSDPAGLHLEGVHPTRDETEMRVLGPLAGLGVTTRQ